jgi:hypothetical protein
MHLFISIENLILLQAHENTNEICCSKWLYEVHFPSATSFSVLMRFLGI